ncbi:transposase [Ochrobactrum soli]|uniref:transposase n=1 Tax=Brucella/Ochrobactrum group TaxID=2826938 RepID=UPI000EF25A61|nr:transposase [[Ochrobactrum] soli]RLL64468.1 transposase [[Ochrobactrum] soli]
MRRILSDTVNQARTSEVLTAEPVRSRRRPRDWSDDEKAPIVAASLQPGANVAAVTRSEGLDHSQLYGWRRKALAFGVVSPVTAGPASPAMFARVETTSSASIDIVVADMVVRVGSAFDPDRCC